MGSSAIGSALCRCPGALEPGDEGRWPSKFPPRFRRKGGGGVFLREIPSMLLMGLMLGGGYLVYFARFCALFATFRRVRSGLASMESAPGLFLLLCAFGE